MKLDLNHALYLLDIVQDNLRSRGDELEDGFELDFIRDDIQRLDTVKKAIRLELEKSN